MKAIETQFPMHDRQEQLIELLRDASHLSDDDVKRALDLSWANNTTLAEELVVSGLVSPEQAWAALGEIWHAPIVDVNLEPADPELLRSQPVHAMVGSGYAPWRMTSAGELTLVTTVEPKRRMLRDARIRYGALRVVARTISPRDLEDAIEAACKEQLLYKITDQHADTHPRESARRGLKWWQKAIPFGLPTALVILAFFYANEVFVGVFLAANLVFYVFIIFKTYLAIRAPIRRFFKSMWQRMLGRARVEEGIPVLSNAVRYIPDDELPIYTILVPVFREANIVGKLVENLDRIDYPKSKLQVLILLEEEDQETIAAAHAAHPPPYMTIMVVPDGQPRTKPRACNYGLALARGEFVVIFDAEDRPDPDQLRKSIAAFQENTFRRAHMNTAIPELACVQAALSYFNSDYNLLTRLFSIEYSHWFDAMLPGMEGSGLPMPLGGTSNHFRTSVLREIGGWDPYNVTEDADLGMRIANRGYAIGSIPSSTHEEACAQASAWIKQRTRWIKGYLVTSAVYLSHPISFLRTNGIGGALSQFILILGTPISFMVYPFALLFTLITWLGVQFSEIHFPPVALDATLFVMVFGMSMLIITSAISTGIRYGWRLACYAPLIPAYWFMHSAAAWRAAYQSIFDPHRWEKTPHGLTEDYVTGEDSH